MKYAGMNPHEHAYKYELKRQLVRDHLLECYEEILRFNGKNIVELIKLHKKFIHKTQIIGKNKYKTLLLLEQYKNAKNKSMAMMVLTNTLSRRGAF